MIGVPCLGVCDQAPAMLVNKDRHHKVTIENVDQILSKYAPLT
jgi:NADH:ubiquinone oxidoreductase subunit E